MTYKPEEKGMQLDMQQAGIAGDISSTPGDAHMWSFLRKCLDNCIKGHEKCKVAQDPTFYPQRLLRLSRDKFSGDTIQLILTQDHPPSSPYITLSHCWGTIFPFCTTRKNISRVMKYISLSELPRTFQDCVVAAHELGIQYIWIDSLCIIQDDRQDWARHAGAMDKIYENALVTLAAVSSPDGSVPFLGPDAPSDRDNWQAVNIDIDTGGIGCWSVENRSTQAQLKVRKYGPILLPGFINGPLEKRGWAWQERYLSGRIINFTLEEARWHCRTSHTCECIGIMQSTNPSLPKESALAEDEGEKLTPIRKWRHIVTEYSRRQLTYSTDRLPALSGVASRFQASLKGEYLAGMWLADFPRCLAWYRRELSDSPAGKPKMWRSLDNGVPSWSWASISAESHWIWDYNVKDFNLGSEVDIPIESRVELVSTSCRPLSNNNFGEVEKGSYIELRGLVVEAEMDSDIYGCACVRRRGSGPQHVVPDCHIVSATDSSLFKSYKTLRRALPNDRLDHGLSEGKRSKGPVYCLLLFTATQNGKDQACILILGKQIGRGDTYQRLGIGNSDIGWSRPLYNNRKDWDAWEGWEQLEEWEKWEKWFADGVVRTLKIL